MPRNYKTSGYKARQYEDIARLLGQAKRILPAMALNALEALNALHHEFAVMFARDNDRFDTHRFDSRVEEWRTGKRS